MCTILIFPVQTDRRGSGPSARCLYNICTLNPNSLYIEIKQIEGRLPPDSIFNLGEGPTVCFLPHRSVTAKT
jgi:hypothetical protein